MTQSAANSWLDKLRSHALTKFDELGRYEPLERSEAWKYTSLKSFDHEIFQPQNPNPGLINFEDVLSGAGDAGFQKSFLEDPVSYLQKNGKPLSGFEATEGVRIESVASAVKNQSKILKDYLNVSLPPQGHEPLFLENTAQFKDGALIYVPQGAHLSLPVYFFSIGPRANHASCYLRNLVILEPAASLTWVEDYISNSDAAYLSQVVNEIVLKPESSLNHVKIQREGGNASHFCTNRILQYEGSSYSSDVFMTGGMLARNEIHVEVLDQNCRTRLNGTYMGSGSQHLDHHINVEHTKPHQVSSQFYRGTLRGRSTGVFRGRIHVHPNAQRIKADQSNKTLLFSRDAQMNTKPQLEIFADDVECSHGATIGQIEDQAMFYIKSRGISQEEAEQILEEAFLSEAWEGISDARIKKYFHHLFRSSQSDSSPMKMIEKT